LNGLPGVIGIDPQYQPAAPEVRNGTAGFLGGLAPVTSFNPLLQMPSGVHFSLFGSFVFGTPKFPVSDIPFQGIADRVAAGKYQAKPARMFRFDEKQEAHRAMESNQANGKLVVRL
jgi:NADPH:quinone reductase-like Zn-dependent oxidoreductase